MIAIACAEVLAGLPDLPSDNALPRWLAEVAGYAVEELTARRLRFDVDDPLDLVLLRRARPSSPLRVPPGIDTSRAEAALGAGRAVARDASAELLVAGRASSASLAWLELRTAARVRALIEERGLRRRRRRRASGPARRRRPCWERCSTGTARRRSGHGSPGWATAALVDSRVLLAHRLGADERAGRAAEDRFASDLLLHERIADPWLRALTRSAADAPVPIVLGGHTLVGPGHPPGAAVTMDGLRRISALDLDLVESDAELAAAIRDEIAATGPMTFARFMELALYDPERGYYRAPPRGRAATATS